MFIFKPEIKFASILLNDFIDNKMHSYSRFRNYDLGIEKNSKNLSFISPYVSAGILKEKQILINLHKRSNVDEKFVQEIFWRTYWKGRLEITKKIWRNYKEYIKNYNNDPKYIKNNLNYRKAIEGSTKIEPFNKWVSELKENGYLHNHTRMWFASIWIHYLNLPWELGADFFLKHLLDGDVSSNTLSWRWVAGLQTFGKKYIATEDNINKYTNNRFKGFNLPKLKQYLPNEEEIVKPEKKEYPYGYIPNDNDILLINQSNLNNTYALELCKKYKQVFIVDFELGDLEKSSKVLEFQSLLLKDYKNEIKKNHEVVSFSLPKDLEKIVLHLKSLKFNKIVYEYLNIGYEKDILESLISALRKNNFKVESILDPFYLNCWEYCNKGFFNFKSKFPKLINDFIK